MTLLPVVTALSRHSAVTYIGRQLRPGWADCLYYDLGYDYDLVMGFSMQLVMIRTC